MLSSQLSQKQGPSLVIPFIEFLSGRYFEKIAFYAPPQASDAK